MCFSILNGLGLHLEHLLDAQLSLLYVVQGSLLFSLEHRYAVVQLLDIILYADPVLPHLCLRKGRRPDQRFVVGLLIEEPIRPGRCRKELLCRRFVR